MGKYNIVAIGGTGSRCLEALIHLCACGMGPEQLFVMVVDPDESHGNTEKLKKVIADYQKCYNIVAPSQSIFKTKINFPEESVTWSPARRGQSLKDYFNYDTLVSSSNELADICNLLYTEAELKMEWDRGFCGRTSIGAPVMAKIKDGLDEKPWNYIIQNIEDNLGAGEDARLFVFGSIFGATGASGFPVVGSILRKRFENNTHLCLGGALILPYFSFLVPPKQTGVFSSPKDFLLKTKVALEHYSFVWDKLPHGGKAPYDAIYLMGEKTLDIRQDEEDRKFAIGSVDQNNYAHFVELLAALSCLDFHGKELKKDSLQQNIAARKIEDVINWADLPSMDLKEKLLIFSTLAFAYRVFYHPLLKELDLPKKPYLASWFIDNFLKVGLLFDKESSNLDVFGDYLKSYLEWLFELCFSTDIDLQFINRNALKLSRDEDFNKLNDEYFRTLSPMDAPKCAWGYDSIWSELCNIRLHSAIGTSSPTGRFAFLLYEGAKRFCETNYSLK